MCKMIIVESCIVCPYQKYKNCDTRFCKHDMIVSAESNKFFLSDPSDEDIQKYNFDGRELEWPAPGKIPNWCPLEDKPC